MTPSESSTTGVQKNLPFGSMPDTGGGPKDGTKRRRSRRGGRRRRRRKGEPGPGGEGAGSADEDGLFEGPEGDDEGEDGPDTDGDERDDAPGDDRAQGADTGSDRGPGAPQGEPRDGGPSLHQGPRLRRRQRGRKKRKQHLDAHGAPAPALGPGHGHGAPRGPHGADAARRGPHATDEDPDGGRPEEDPEHDPGDEPREDGEGGLALDTDEPEEELPGARDPRANKPLPREAGGVFNLDKGGIGELRLEEYQYLPSKWDIYVPKRVVQHYKLRDGMLVHGRVSKGYKHKLQLDDVLTIDGKDPRAWKNKPTFQSLTSVDPDFHYAIGDVTGEVSMRVVDLLAPIGRGQRALLVAPPRTGKTTLLRQFAQGIEEGYPDVQLLVLLVDERPEEATEWKRSVTRGKVFVSTADESAKHHIAVAEAVWKRACRMVECGDDVIILLDSITRLARAYNNQAGAGGRTMSGGLDSRAMERPRKIFGSARNTVEAGSLTIIGTCLVDTGSRMDTMVFEEFKGTGNSEIVLSRRLADRRIFPAIDVEKSGTRKEEKLVGTKRLRQIHTLRRVLARMHFAEAMDLLVTRLGEAAKTQDFLERFTIDPEA